MSPKKTVWGLIIVVLMLIPNISFTATAQEKNKKEKIIEINVMILVDGSHNMNKYWNKQKKVDILKKALPEVFQEISKDPSWGFNVGMRSFGEQSSLSIKDCTDTKLRTKIEWFDPIVLTHCIEGLRPKGMSCLSHAIRTSAEDFRTGPGFRHHYVVIITAGGDECGMDPVAACRYLKSERVIIDSLHIVGLNLPDSTAKVLKNAAEITEGHFINVKNPNNLKRVLLDYINYYARAREPQHGRTEKKKQNK